jgi:alkylation response protein AidB-like acyl-CoA dehydrogenase
MMSLSTAIAGGASNIQRNIIGERLLGLPRDQRPPEH